MKTMLNKVERLMLEHTVWIFFTVLMFYSTLFVQHSKPQTWLVYLTYLSMFCVMFSPVNRSKSNIRKLENIMEAVLPMKIKHQDANKSMQPTANASAD